MKKILLIVVLFVNAICFAQLQNVKPDLLSLTLLEQAVEEDNCIAQEKECFNGVYITVKSESLLNQSYLNFLGIILKDHVFNYQQKINFPDDFLDPRVVYQFGNNLIFQFGFWNQIEHTRHIGQINLVTLNFKS